MICGRRRLWTPDPYDLTYILAHDLPLPDGVRICEATCQLDGHEPEVWHHWDDGTPTGWSIGWPEHPWTVTTFTVA